MAKVKGTKGTKGTKQGTKGTKVSKETKGKKSKVNNKINIDIEQINKFLVLLQQKSLKEIWSSKDIIDQKKQARDILQQIIRQWYKKDKIRQFPIYISLKPKKHGAKVFSGNKTSIVLFPIQLLNYPAKTSKDLQILNFVEILNSLSNAYIRVVEIQKGRETAEKVEKSINRRLKALFK